jgi:hypothetical protein
MNKLVKTILEKAAEENGLSFSEVEKIYKSQFLFIKRKMEEFKLEEGISIKIRLMGLGLIKTNDYICKKKLEKLKNQTESLK